METEWHTDMNEGSEELSEYEAEMYEGSDELSEVKTDTHENLDELSRYEFNENYGLDDGDIDINEGYEPSGFTRYEEMETMWPEERNMLPCFVVIVVWMKMDQNRQKQMEMNGNEQKLTTLNETKQQVASLPFMPKLEVVSQAQYHVTCMGLSVSSIIFNICIQG
jgi:hypothetical protein